MATLTNPPLDLLPQSDLTLLLAWPSYSYLSRLPSQQHPMATLTNPPLDLLPQPDLTLPAHHDHVVPHHGGQHLPRTTRHLLQHTGGGLVKKVQTDGTLRVLLSCTHCKTSLVEVNQANVSL